MPKLTGKEVLQCIQDNECFKRSKVIMYSGNMQEDDMEECKKLGAFDCLKKTHDMNLLRSGLRDVLMIP